MHNPDDETHLVNCPDCQARAGLGGLDVDLDRAWNGVAAEVWATDKSRIERAAASLLRSPGLARALVSTPSLLLSWLLATAAVLVAGALFDAGTGQTWVALLAPALAGVGISYAYGPGVDPAFELSRTMAVSDRLVLLARALAVFAVNSALGVGASLVSPAAAGVTFAFLVPMSAVCALALAAATLARSANAGAAAALLGWGMIISVSAARTGEAAAAVSGGALVPVYLTAAAVFVVIALYATGEGWKGAGS